MLSFTNEKSLQVKGPFSQKRMFFCPMARTGKSKVKAAIKKILLIQIMLFRFVCSRLLKGRLSVFVLL